MFNYLVFASIFLVGVGVAGGTCTRGAIRYDPAHNNTVIQICFANRWGYICANSNQRTRQRIANVICQQMGYSRHSDTGLYMKYIYCYEIHDVGIIRKEIRNPHPKPLLINWLSCSDKPILQQNLLDCSHLTNELTKYLYGYQAHICDQSSGYYYYIAASNCINTSVCQNGQIQLLDTNAVLLCTNGEWNALCSETWSSTQAQVVCRQLGMNTKGINNIKSK